jgi:hypothetical protein
MKRLTVGNVENIFAVVVKNLWLQPSPPEARGTPEKVSLLTENLVDNLPPIFYTFKEFKNILTFKFLFLKLATKGMNVSKKLREFIKKK